MGNQTDIDVIASLMFTCLKFHLFPLSGAHSTHIMVLWIALLWYNQSHVPVYLSNKMYLQLIIPMNQSINISDVRVSVAGSN